MGKGMDGPERLYEPLTPREQNILGHLAKNKSGQEIAGLETLAYSSVKWYIHQVYAKLGVNRRREAVARARELGLLQPEPVPPGNALNVKNNLPAERTRFFGREAEIGEVRQRLAEWRMLTLTSSGGVGKTRLAQRVAEKVQGDYANGVWFVELASLSDPELVIQQVAASLGLREEAGRLSLALPEEAGQRMLERLKGFLCSRASLLVLDNCEHLRDACAHLADRLLQACSQVKILATSREPLGVAGEAVFRVPSLPFPAPGQQVTPEIIDKYAAVRLFTDRARQILPGYQVTAQNAGAVASICQRLDGIPLAIELAAARLSMMTAEELAARLGNVFHLLTGGSRSALPRQQTLRATLDWSYNLLSERESRLLRRLAVFAGGWDLAGAEAVCAGEGLAASDILELLANLVNKSLVMASRTSASGGGTHYRMLETIRQYAHEKLIDSQEMTALLQQHLAYFAILAETLEPEAHGPNQKEWRRRLEDELENIRLALETGLREDPQAGLRLASALWWFWGKIGRVIEGQRWLKTYLDHPENAARTARRGHALWRLANIFVGGPPDEIEHAAQESLEIFRSLNDLAGQGFALHSLGATALNWRENITTAREHFAAALKIFEELHDQWWLALTLNSLAQVTGYQGDVASQFVYLEKALHLFRKIGDQEAIAAVLGNLGGLISLFQGDLRRGYAMLVESEAIYQQFELRNWSASGLAEVLCWQGEFERARQSWEEMLENAHQSDEVDDAIVTNLFVGRFICLAGRLEAGVALMEQAIRSLKEAYPIALDTNQTWLMELAYAHACLGEIERAESLVGEFGNLFQAAQYQPRLMRLRGFMAFQKGKAEPSARYYRESLRLADQMQWRLDALLALEGYAWALNLNIKPVEAARLLGAAAEFRARIGARVFPRDRPVYDQVIAALKDSLGEEGYAAAWAEGQAQGFMQAVEQAINS